MSETYQERTAMCHPVQTSLWKALNDEAGICVDLQETAHAIYILFPGMPPRMG